MIREQRSQALGTFMKLEKGKPPLIQPYDGLDAELYLTPEYLRGRGAAEFIKPPRNAVHVVDGETIVLWDGSNAGEIFRAKRGALASTMSRIRYGDDFTADYFYYSLKNWENYLKGQTSGSGIPHVDKEVLGKLTLFACEKSEQSKIAEVLSTVDQAIAQMEALIAKRQRVRTGLMQDLLTRGIDQQGNVRSEETHEFKDSPLGRIPVEWGVLTLNQCANRVVVGLASSTTHAYRDAGIPMIRNQNIRRGYFDDREMLYLDPAFASLFPNKAVRSGDVLTVRTGANVGDTAMVPEKYVGSPTFTTLITSLTHDLLIPEYLVWYINSELGDRELNRIMVGGGKENLNVGQFVHFRIPVPNVTDQRVVVQCLSAIGRQITDETTVLEKYRLIKNSLMQDLLAGNKRVTPLLDPAEAV